MKSKERLYWPYVLIALILVVVAFLIFSPTLVTLDPGYRAAESLCYSIKKGTTYSQVQAEYGNLFSPAPASYVDSSGTGQVWLNNTSTQFSAHCQIEFTNSQVTATNFLNESSF